MASWSPSLDEARAIASPMTTRFSWLPSPAIHDAARARQDGLLKPPGSLGKLEDLATRYAVVRGAPSAADDPRIALVIFAADHGVVAEGVSAYPREITRAMVSCIARGVAAVSVLARSHGVPVSIVDVGVVGEEVASDEAIADVTLTTSRVRAGTRNLRFEAAMTTAEVERAMAFRPKAMAFLCAYLVLIPIGPQTLFRLLALI